MREKEIPTIESDDGRCFVSVFAIGTTVIAGSVTAKIKTISIGERGRVEYEVVWWSGETRNSAWVAEMEIQPLELTTGERIGFK